MMLEQLVDLEERMFLVMDRGAEFQGKVDTLLKTDTGSYSADVVTQADFWVQKELLQLFLSTPLRACRLVAEERTPELQPLLDGFAETSEYQLFLDPIDGTRRFLEGLPYFSSIVTLMRNYEPIYTLAYYPRLRWWIRIGASEVSRSGALPLELPAHPPMVVFTSGSPDRDFDDWRGGELQWIHGSSLHPAGSKLLYLSGSVAGYACSNPNLYDGLMMYHYAKVSGHDLRAELDLSRWENGPHGLFVAGRYLCIQARAC